MKQFLILLSLVCLTLVGYGQIDSTTEDSFIPTPPPPPTYENTVYSDVNTLDQAPQFPGGEEAILKYLAANIVYPEKARNAGTQGTIYISFVIDRQGFPKDCEVARGIKGEGADLCHTEALNAVCSMPQWKPGIINGNPVNTKFTIPIKLTIGKKK